MRRNKDINKSTNNQTTHAPDTCAMTAGSCPAVEVRMIPGRSTTVRSGTSGEDSRTLIVSVEKLLDVEVSPSVNFSSNFPS